MDTFSLGVILFMMAGGFLPFDDDDEKLIAKKTLFKEPHLGYKTFDDVSQDCKDLLKSVLHKNG